MHLESAPIVIVAWANFLGPFCNHFMNFRIQIPPYMPRNYTENETMNLTNITHEEL